ncbi:MAG: low molecular weight protein tyrosine phosphatase family protein [Elusimicrobia bacterium]|nr:low molecular weight protein tyrosine phosphatase family protein [Elusimicrobiota bacterium]
MKKLLFICSQNRLRSPTAEAVFCKWPGVEAMSAGLNNDAAAPVSSDLIEWADILVVMEQAHKIKLSRKFRSSLKGKRVVVLGIPDEYEYMQPELVQRLKAAVPRRVGI